MLLSASPGEVVDQIEKVECHQEEGKHEKQSEYHAGGSDNNIHDAGLVLGLKSNDCRIERANDSRILLMNFQIYLMTYDSLTNRNVRLELRLGQLKTGMW